MSNGEMTVTEHNEQLILQKNQLSQTVQAERNQVGLMLAAMMRQTKRKKVTIKPEQMIQPGVHLEFQEDGSIVVTFQTPRDSNGET